MSIYLICSLAAVAVFFLLPVILPVFFESNQPDTNMSVEPLEDDSTDHAQETESSVVVKVPYEMV